MNEVHDVVNNYDFSHKRGVGGGVKNIIHFRLKVIMLTIWMTDDYNIDDNGDDND